MQSYTPVRIHHAAGARAAPALLPRCRGHSRRQHRFSLARAAETVVETTIDQRTFADQEQEQQQVPLHIARRLAALQEEVQQAYESGYNAGYTAGVKVQVNVGVDMTGSSSSSRPQAQPQQQHTRLSSSSSITTNSNSTSSNQESQQAPVTDSLARSAVKGLVWRLFSTTATMGIALLVLHDVLKVEDALKLGALEFTAKFLLYFAHERLWASIKSF